MPEVDLPKRLARYGGDVIIKRVALRLEDTVGKAGHDVQEKKKDSRIKWWHEHNLGPRFWELDGMDPRDLRQRLYQEIEALVDMPAWQQSQATEEAERQACDPIPRLHETREPSILLASKSMLALICYNVLFLLRLRADVDSHGGTTLEQRNSHNLVEFRCSRVATAKL